MATYNVIDVSNWQDKIDWKKVKASGITGAIIRYADGTDVDSRFEENMKNAKSAGLHIGAYTYSRAKNKAQAEDEAKRLYNACKKYSPDLPLYIDLEAKGLEKYADTVASAFLNKMKALGGRGGVYANLNWWNNYLTKTAKNYSASPFWIAQYNDRITHKNPSLFGMWQYTNNGSVDGIKGHVDRDRLYIEYWKTAPKPKSYTGEYPTTAEIKTASNNGARASMLKWSKDIVASGKYKYKRFTDDPKTHQCPICHPNSEDGWNCMGYAIASWKHGSKLPCNCSCAWMGDGEWDKILKMSDADALAYAQRKTGLKDVKVIRNGGKTIPNNKLQAGDILGLYDGNDIQHIVLYIGNGKITDSTSGRKPNIAYGVPMYKEYQAKVAIRYTGGHDYMQFYDRGTGVEKVKGFLAWYDHKNKFADDDVFGTGTESAVKSFQEKEMGKSQADGLVGIKTIAKMKVVKK